MRALTTRETATAVDVSRPESLLSAPPWLLDRLAAVSPWGQGREKNGVVVPTIPASLKLTGSMRQAIERRVDQLDLAQRPGPEDDIEMQVAQLVARYATGKTDQASAAVRVEWYMDVLGELPAWAVTEAIRRWRRGQCGSRNYDFAPSEATLREVALGLVMSTKGQALILRRLLTAEPEEPMTEAQLEANRVRFGAMMADLSKELKAARPWDHPQRGEREGEGR